jgi:hypothetical protein
MPYTGPATSPALSPSNPNKGWPFPSVLKPIGFKKSCDDSDLYSNEIDRNNAIKEVKDILSTSPQLSTSPRRKSAPESYSRKPSLKVDLPVLPLPEIPCILRKKSGEIVKSSLKKGLSKSEPVTPTFPKYVHFNADLEQIKLFNEAQRPQAVSADVSSDEDSDDDDNVFDDNMLGFSASDDEDENSDEPELTISLPNRPMITTLHSSKPVFVETIYLSQDKRKLQGRIMVQNIAFQKSVDIRYTFDFWSTVSEVPAIFAEGIPSKDNKNSFDAFTFSIELIDNSRNPIDGKTMYFAVHYSVENNDYWDNNNGSNYQVNFKRVASPSASRYSTKKNKNIQQQSSISSKWSMPRQSTKNLNESLCRSPPTLESSPKLNVDDVRKKVMGRYDIGVSLSAAQNAQKSSAPQTPTSDYTSPFQFFAPQVPYGNYGNYGNYNNETFHTFFPNNYVDGMPGTSDFPISHSSGFGQLNNSNPIAIPSSKPDIGSSSYYDLVNQYCFYSGSPYTAKSPITAGSPPVMT